VFIEDYDLVVARHLVQGVDVWLNTPRRGMEASGTSGMKVLPNGGLNLSVLDGWWCEGYSARVGWAIGRGEDYEDHEYQDFVESNALYDILENDVVPLFYQRAVDGLPRGWISMMKRSIQELTPRFSSNRMVSEYTERYYVPAARRATALAGDGLARARGLAEWKSRVSRGWSGVRIESVGRRSADEHRFGDRLDLEARVCVDGLAVEDLCVEIRYGAVDEDRQFVEPRTVLMAHAGSDGPGILCFTGTIPCDRSGMMGYAVRVRPLHSDDPNALSTGLMTWA
jgi:starch phosphorylase